MRVLWCLALVGSASAAQTIDSARLIWQKDATLADVEAQAERVHRRMDLNGDGFVTREELKRAANARVGHLPSSGDPDQPTPPLVEALFDAADADHDGRISETESKAGADAEFARDDTNHDGVVTPDERLAGMKQFAQQHLKAIQASSPYKTR